MFSLWNEQFQLPGRFEPLQ